MAITHQQTPKYKAQLRGTEIRTGEGWSSW